MVTNGSQILLQSFLCMSHPSSKLQATVTFIFSDRYFFVVVVLVCCVLYAHHRFWPHCCPAKQMFLSPAYWWWSWESEITRSLPQIAYPGNWSWKSGGIQPSGSQVHSPCSCLVRSSWLRVWSGSYQCLLEYYPTLHIYGQKQSEGYEWKKRGQGGISKSKATGYYCKTKMHKTSYTWFLWNPNYEWQIQQHRFRLSPIPIPWSLQH